MTLEDSIIGDEVFGRFWLCNICGYEVEDEGDYDEFN